MTRALNSLGLRCSTSDFHALVEHGMIDYPRSVQNYHLVADLKELCEHGRDRH